MSRRRRIATALMGVAASLIAVAAFAESEAPPALSREWSGEAPRVEATCEPDDLRFAGAPMFRVRAPAAGRVHFLARKERCRGNCPHLRADSLAPGDIAFAGPEDRGFRCVAAGTPQGRLTGGFLAAENLVPATPDTALSGAFLLGTWRRDSTSLIRFFTRGPEGIVAQGSGTWRGAGTINEGGFSAAFTAIPPLLLLRDGGCAVIFERRGPYLLVNDNARCGGNNVRFVGIYIRQRPQR